MDHPKTIEWDKKLKGIFEQIDEELEEIYGASFPLTPQRPARGETANPSYSGLFNIGASFSPGYGSTYGRGYVVEISLRTFEKVPQEFKNKIEDEVVARLEKKLPVVFPERKLFVKKDQGNIKIFGDLHLGTV